MKLLEVPNVRAENKSLFSLFSITKITITKWEPKSLEIWIKRRIILVKTFSIAKDILRGTYTAWLVMGLWENTLFYSLSWSNVFSFWNIFKNLSIAVKNHISKRLQRHNTKSLRSTHILLIYAVVIKSAKTQFIKCSS